MGLTKKPSNVVAVQEASSAFKTMELVAVEAAMTPAPALSTSELAAWALAVV
jgi:hypothetical protein